MTRWPYAIALAGALVMIGTQADMASAQKKFARPTGPIDPIGQPDAFQKFYGKGAMSAIWFDPDDKHWHLRVTSPQAQKRADRKAFSGRVRIDGDAIRLKAQGLDKTKRVKSADWVFPHSDGRGFDYNFATFGMADGIDFQTDKATKEVTFTLKLGGAELPNRVLIGKKGYAPDKIPFTLPARPGEE